MDVVCEGSFCRLCADVKDNFLQIYDAEGYKLAIGAKISKCLQIQVRKFGRILPCSVQYNRGID